MSELPELFNEISNTAKKQGWTPLACASDAGNMDKVAELLDSMHVDIDIDGRDYDGRTPIALAARNGHTGIVARLLAHGADPNLRDLQQTAPLWHAARHGHAPVVRALLESGRLFDVNPRPLNPSEYQSETPLAIALEYDHRETAELLARADGIDPFVEVGPDGGSYQTCSVLALAIRRGYEDVALVLLENRDLGSGSSYAASSSKRYNDSADAGSIHRETGDTRSNNSDSEDASSRIDDGSNGVGSSNYPSSDSLQAESIDNNIDDARSEYNYSDNSNSHTLSSYLPKRTVQFASKLLVLAAGAGYYRVVQELLVNHSADVNALHIHHDRRGFVGGGGIAGCVEESPLFAASRRGHSSIVRLLLDTEGIQPDLRCSHISSGDTALGSAAGGGFVDIVRMLAADTRVEIDHKDQLGGRTPLSYAAEYGHEAVVAWLLETEAVDPDSQCSSGYTPLMYAVSPFQRHITVQWEAQEGVVRRLLASGRVNTNQRNESLLSRMARCPSTRPVKAILEHLGTDLDRGQWSMLLRSAAESGSADTVQMLLDAPPMGADAVKTSLEDGMHSALQLAAYLGKESVVQVLLSGPGINLNGTYENGWTPLMMAARRHKVGVVKQLSSVAGIDPNMQDDKGWTALCYDCSSDLLGDTPEILGVLLRIPGIDPNLANNLGRTALSLVAEIGCIERVDILLAVNGIDPDARDTSGRSPLSWALKSHGFKKGDYSLQNTNDRKQVVRRLIALPAVDINAEDAEGLTPLLRAIKIDFSDEFVALLQEHGAIASDDAALSYEPAVPVVDSDSCYSGSGRHHVASSDSMLDRPIGLGERVRQKLRENMAREYLLPLGTQQEYFGKQAAETVDKLCSMCAAIDLDATFSNRHTKHGGRVIAELGRVDKSWEERSCSFCRLFAAIRPSRDIDGRHKLVSFSTTQSWLCHEQLPCWYDIKDSWVDTMVLAVVAGPVSEERVGDGFRDGFEPDPNRVSLKIVKGALSAGLIGRLGSNCPKKKNAITIPRLTPYGGDSTMSMAKSWITRCRKRHSMRCNPRKLAPVPHFRLIECNTRRIIRVEESATADPPKYVALSYVWGQPPRQPQPHQPQDNPVEKVSSTVEAVIEDAIRVALALGYEYLWVDRYCVVQTGNEAIKMEQLRHMHTVYANAEVTLVAAAGTGPSAGLPGAPGDSQRFQQPSAIVSGHALVCIPPDPTHHIRSASAWATRGWTFQEGLLARRRLFFSDYEVSYECRDMLCREALRLPRSMERAMSGRVPRLMDPQWMYKPYKLPGMRSDDDGTSLFDLLAAYSVRKLSLPSDALNAMLGIFQQLGEKECRPIYHTCGVPILYQSDQSATAWIYPPTPDGFIKGLCWRLQQPARRRLEFPSWSWAGWYGVVKSMREFMPLLHHHYRFDVDISIIPHGQDGDAVPWDSYYDQLSTADDSSKDLWSSQQHILEITAYAATVRFRRKLEPVDDCAEWIGTVCAGDRVWQGEFWLTRRDHDDDGDGDTTSSLHSALREKPWPGIVLGNSCAEWYQTHSTYILVIWEQEQKQSAPSIHTCWERVGLLKLENCTLGEDMLERQTWRLA
ncbi:hypothetical protein CEP52_007049 [Fusarium oligoseptatum]|uniref:Heterokaryon incompatibility domain-containing protein n=1 Tax=Fusarium oligoseptatum TaxID=2604345 RepID=A0A428TPT3_9HYPO|nr:hypothetical protein CEP52_007049 [Fusarium oligoseptatum]